ncbi:DUF2130 domain-containing protein [Mycoplasmopsis verecunda]|uniref:DUF2130 domain-containing protein n=1 Tax=Mycoplasmopsis verecunda TaxID=171291 RepID=A0A1T4L0L0_9BACT|nr:DUF2130 domain-containing protein [Mycoplasmopsis verecunda]WPB54398.1 DUF2130 domain-containing protein [Mycoplasmopsis verecunda]SJZ48264.1 hypothetical protein SAMN02745154_00277 [Mycoplasmopsis verecunda]
MSNKINIKIKDFDSLEIELLSNAFKGDYVSLLDLGPDNISVLFDKYKEQSSAFISKIKQQGVEEYIKDLEKRDEVIELLNNKKEWFVKKLNEKDQQINENIDKLNEQKNQIDVLNTKLQTANEQSKLEIENALIKINSEYETQIKSLNNQIELLRKQHQAKLEAIEENKALSIQNTLASEKEKIKKEFNDKLNQEIEKVVVKSKAEQKQQDEELANKDKEIYSSKIEELKNEVLSLKNENIKLTQAKYMMSTKEVGENFEDSIENYLDELYGVNPYIICERTTESKNSEGKNTNEKGEGSKPDFKITFYNTQDGRNDEVVGCIIIEAKNQASLQGNQKNKSFYKKLDKERSKFKAEIAFLVTTLEPHESYFVKNIKDYPSVYQMRFEAIPQMINIWHRFFNERAKLHRLDINLESKAKLLAKFDDFKRELIDTKARLFGETIDNMMKQVDNMSIALDKLREYIDNELKKRYERLVKKIESFSLQKEFKNINDDEDLEVHPALENKVKSIENIQDVEIIDEQ